jgi:hypothetical protein
MQDKIHNHSFYWVTMLSLILFTKIYSIIIISFTNCNIYKNSIVWIIFSVTQERLEGSQTIPLKTQSPYTELPRLYLFITLTFYICEQNRPDNFYTTLIEYKRDNLNYHN